MSSIPPATREDVTAVLGEVDDSYVNRVVDIGASLDELGEAIDFVANPAASAGEVPSSEHVAMLHGILQELVDSRGGAAVFPLRGVAVSSAIPKG